MSRSLVSIVLSIFEGADGSLHGRRKTSHPSAGFLRVVQPACPESAVSRLRASARLHDRAAVRLGALGEHSGSARPAVQGKRAPERRVSAVHSEKFYRERKAPRGRLLAGTGGGDDRRRRRAG